MAWIWRGFFHPGKKGLKNFTPNPRRVRNQNSRRKKRKSVPESAPPKKKFTPPRHTEFPHCSLRPGFGDRVAQTKFREDTSGICQAQVLPSALCLSSPHHCVSLLCLGSVDLPRTEARHPAARCAQSKHAAATISGPEVALQVLQALTVFGFCLPSFGVRV